MNDEPPAPFDTVGDEPVEARIVAWVLGEASAFEAAELERLCEERPELLVFRRRMRALHGLLTEAEASEADHSWRLPPEKRKLLDEICGAEKVVRLEPEVEQSIHRSARRAWLAIAACVMLGVVVMQLIPRKYESKVTLEVKPRTSGMSPLAEGGMKPQFFGTEFGKIKSNSSLEKVVDNLDLADRWKVDKQTAVKRLKENITTGNVRGTALIDIRVRDAKKQDADEIAMEVTKAYKEYRSEIENRDSARALFELNKAVRDQEDKVEERRKVLATIVRTKGIIYKGQDSFYGQAGVDEDQAAAVARNDRQEDAIKRGLDAQDYVDAKRDFETDQDLLQKLKLKQIGETISSKMPDESIAIVESPYSQSALPAQASAPPPASKPTSTSAPAEMTMSLAKDENGRKDALENKKRSERLTRAGTGTLALETQKSLPEMAESSKIESLPKGPAPLWSGGVNGGALGDLEKNELDFKSSAGRFANADELAAGQPAPEQDGLKDSITAGLRSGDQAISRNSIDAILNNPNGRTAGELVVPGAARPASKAKADKGASAAPMPTLAGKDSGLQNQIVDGDAAADDLVMGVTGPKEFEGTVNSGAPVDGIPLIGRLFRSASSAFDSPTKIEDANGVENAIELRKGGKADELRKMQEALATAKSKNEEIHREMDSLDDPIRSNAALTYEQSSNVDKVRRGLYMAEGNFNLGKYDDSKKAYEEILKTDPSNAAARRGLEKVDQVKSDYYRAAYDHTRAELLSQVDSSWELAVPGDKMGGFTSGSASRNENYSDLPARALDLYHTEYEPPTLSNPLAGNTNADNLDLHSSATSRDYYDGSTKAPNQNFDLKKRLEGDGKPLGMEISGANTLNYNLSAGANRTANNPQAPAIPEPSPEEATFPFETKGNLSAALGSALWGKVAQSDAGKAQEILASDSSTSNLQAQFDPSDFYFQGYLSSRSAEELEANGDFEGAAEKLGKAREMFDAISQRYPAWKPNMVNVRSKMNLEAEARIQLKAEEQRKKNQEAANPQAETDKAPDEAQPDQRKLVDLMEEITASENPYSTFSLNISDASFQLAKAALAKGERPDPASIKPEQFYNAVDYGDPAPSSNAPVASTIEQSAHPIIPGRNLVRVALRTASVGRAASQPLHLTLLVDQSGSMVREDRRAAMEQALKQLGGLLTKNDSVTIIGFSRTPHLLADGLSGDQGAKLGDIINQTASEGGTNLEEAMKLGAQKAAEHQLAGAQNRIVLFTDGAANLGNADPEKLAKQVTALRQKGIAFDIAGIGADGLNDQLLGELARHGNGRYYIVGNEKNDSFAKQLAGAFRPAAENVKVQVNFNPQRVGKYKLIGFEKDRLKTEDFRNDSVDAAELAADEAGVAIYQVEPLAEGTGEIGEVSVRFRDVASGEMVERTWTIPHESSAAAFDRTTPSMQLAGLSLLTAEKLKGGPMADAIDFKLLTEPVASVKQFYGASAPVADMLRMIDALK